MRCLTQLEEELAAALAAQDQMQRKLLRMQEKKKGKSAELQV